MIYEKVKTVLLIVSLVVIIFLILFYKDSNQPAEPQYIYTPVEVPKEVVKVERVEVPIEKIKILPKEKIKKEYVPVEVKVNKDKEVVAIGKVDCPEYPIHITAAVDKKDKEVTLYSKEGEKPKLKLLPGGEFGVKYGVKTNLYNLNVSPELIGYGRYDLIRFKDIYIGGAVEVGSENRAYIYLRVNF